MRKLFIGLCFLPHVVMADVYLDARLGSVIGGKHSTNDGNLPFYAELGVDYELVSNLDVGISVGHRSSADYDGVLPDGGTETQDEHIVGSIGYTVPLKQVSLYTKVSAGKYLRARQEGYPLYYEAGIKAQAQGVEWKFGWLEERQIDGDYRLGSLGIGIRYNLMGF